MNEVEHVALAMPEPEGPHHAAGTPLTVGMLRESLTDVPDDWEIVVQSVGALLDRDIFACMVGIERLSVVEAWEGVPQTRYFDALAIDIDHLPDRPIDKAEDDPPY
ncbi:hypothetical protein [Embleya hyalina]|uniref:Uncharacterized protein n=1 Tax=Embleya hyalina TaxID=516124 RepID=A0A401YR56_9ACTN|nr:hypothetical protein [Embleya hyalina]GCD97035.1 hypothetical protein EHYA_04722 [Embleya hyalina]